MASMFRKRYGLIVDEENWPLHSNDHAVSCPPRLTHSSTPVNGSDELADPSTPTEGMMHPGFHFSVDDENFDEAEFHRSAAMMLAGEGYKPRNDLILVENAFERLESLRSHHELGRDHSGRFGCSCGKSYSTPFRLRQHIHKCASATNSPCSSCDKVFRRKASLERHVATIHNDDNDTCQGYEHQPEVEEARPISTFGEHHDMAPAVCFPEEDLVSSEQPISQQFWIYEGDHTWHRKPEVHRDSGVGIKKAGAGVVETLNYVEGLLKRPGLQLTSVVCELCGDHFDNNGDEFAQHIGHHSLEFAEKRHNCDECNIFFASERDLQRHLQSAALTDHCGLNFEHTSDVCTGHHPPTYYKTCLSSDHDLMQKHLWNWELTQLRSHRAIVARLLAERVTTATSRPMSLLDCKRTYASLLPHLSIACQLNMASDRDNCSIVDQQFDQDIANLAPADLDAHFSQLLETYPEIEEPQFDAPEDHTIPIRPDSGILSPPCSPSKDSETSFLRKQSLRNLARQYRRKTIHELNALFKQGGLNRPHSLPTNLAPPATSFAASAA